MADGENRASEACPRCGSTERFRKMYVTLCDGCNLVLEDRSPATFPATENPEGGFDVESK